MRKFFCITFLLTAFIARGELCAVDQNDEGEEETLRSDIRLFKTSSGIFAETSITNRSDKSIHFFLDELNYHAYSITLGYPSTDRPKVKFVQELTTTNSSNCLKYESLEPGNTFTGSEVSLL